MNNDLIFKLVVDALTLSESGVKSVERYGFNGSCPYISFKVNTVSIDKETRKIEISGHRNEYLELDGKTIWGINVYQGSNGLTIKIDGLYNFVFVLK